MRGHRLGSVLHTLWVSVGGAFEVCVKETLAMRRGWRCLLDCSPVVFILEARTLLGKWWFRDNL